MVRPIEKQGERKNVYLSKEVVDTIEEMSKVEGLNFSQFIDMAIMQMKESENPQIALEKVQKEILIQEKELQELKVKEIALRKIIMNADKWRQELYKKRNDALKIIRNKILQNETIEEERVSKTWGRILHCSHIELLNEASLEISKGI